MNALRRNANGSLIRNAFNGALCSSCCGYTGLYIQCPDGLQIPLSNYTGTVRGNYYVWRFEGDDEINTYRSLRKRSPEGVTLYFAVFRRPGPSGLLRGVFPHWAGDTDYSSVEVKYGTIQVIP